MPPTPSTRLDLFAAPGVATSVLDGRHAPIQTSFPLTPAGDVQFDVPATTNKYLDLSSTYLTVQVSAHKADDSDFHATNINVWPDDNFSEASSSRSTGRPSRENCTIRTELFWRRWSTLRRAQSWRRGSSKGGARIRICARTGRETRTRPSPGRVRSSGARECTFSSNFTSVSSTRIVLCFRGIRFVWNWGETTSLYACTPRTTTPRTEPSLNCTSACIGFDSSTSTRPFRTPTINSC